MPADTAVEVAGLELANPVIAGSGEATMTREGIMAALHAGAAAVVAKSVNESEDARRQLAEADYVLLDEHWRPLAWGPAPGGASLLCRSGLGSEPFERWVATLADCDRLARDRDAFVIASIIVADPAEAVRMATTFEQAGLRWLELNLGSPHASEAATGAILAEHEAAPVASLVRPVRDAVSLTLTVKLSGEGDPLPAVAAARGAGADAVCLAGRHLGFLPDVETRRPFLGTFGAIGGGWSLPLTLRWIAKARARFGRELPIIGTNGARDGLDVIRFLLAGARAVEMTTAVVTDGAGALTRALNQVHEYLGQHGRTAADLTGEAADSVLTYQEAAKR
jgi:dihydroorotate dehydrogenase (NAD+) catalytic subunit